MRKACYPNKDVVLRGISDAFAFRDYIMLRTAIALVSKLITSASKESKVAGSIALDPSNAVVLANTLADKLAACVIIGGSLQSVSEKITTLNEAALELGGSVSAVMRRYRTIGDLTGLTFADVQDWTMETFYFMEV